MSNFYEQIIKLYSRINFPKEYQKICQIDGPNSWYFADESKQFIYVNGIVDNRKLIEIDIKSAFPTICNNLLINIMPEFVTTMNGILDKKEKNIFIATTLRDTPYLKQLHRLSKLIILGYIFDLKNNQDILLLELKKDGCIILTNNETYEFLLCTETQYKNFLVESNFNFHHEIYLKYFRNDKTTSVFYELNNKYELIIKGQYKYQPEFIYETNIKLLSDNIIKDDLNKIYSIDYFNIIRQNNLIDLLKKYYICSNNKILNNDGKYMSFKMNSFINPRIYLQKFLFPTMLGEKLF